MLSRLAYHCAYCGLRVRLTGDPRHPGHGVIEESVPARRRAESARAPNLDVFHRFCASVLRAGGAPGATTASVTLRRAQLGWVTERFEASSGERRFGARHYARLGLHPARLRTALFRRHWQVRKMRCAALASHYYADTAP